MIQAGAIAVELGAALAEDPTGRPCLVVGVTTALEEGPREQLLDVAVHELEAVA